MYIKQIRAVFRYMAILAAEEAVGVGDVENCVVEVW